MHPSATAGRRAVALAGWPRRAPAPAARQPARTLADTRPHGADVSSKQIVVQGPAGEERVRVRRARAGDVPRVLRFVRAQLERAALAPARPQLALADQAARALAQGHSLLAEQPDARRGRGALRGVALGAAVCPWDARLLERGAAAVRCARSRRLLRLAAHCLRAPALHAKYDVRRILQVFLVVPADGPRSAEIVNMLAENSIRRGKEVGFPLVRFDVTNDSIAKTLEEMNVKKEWQLSYDALPEILRELESLPLGAGAGESPRAGAGESPGAGAGESPGAGAVVSPGAGAGESPGAGSSTAPASPPACGRFTVYSALTADHKPTNNTQITLK